MNTDTICALATPTGGALAVVRISGSQTFPILEAICRSEGSAGCNAIATKFSKPRFLSPFFDAEGHTIDEALISVFHTPHSYTGEDSAEISCHGSQYIAQQLLDLLIQHGCRMAHPGEFTQRAFLNGKMDLSQAEAVADLIASKNKATHKLALSQLRGHFSSELSHLREQLLHLTTLLELELDFSDHEDLEFADRSELLTLAQTINAHIVRLAKSFETGQALKQGIPVAIIGKTNVGKSTLLNRLLRDERAIVSDIHGTTRDTIEDVMEIQDIQFRFIDTAGLRTTTDTIEKIGIGRTYQAIEKARIVLWIIDEQPSDADLADLRERTKGKQLIIVRNKADLVPSVPYDTILSHTPIPISAKQGTGIEALEAAIYRAAEIPDIRDNDIIITNARHYEALTLAHSHLLHVIEGLKQQLSGDLIAEDLRLVLSTLGEITGGTITSQETLNNVFTHFCVGK